MPRSSYRASPPHLIGARWTRPPASLLPRECRSSLSYTNAGTVVMTTVAAYAAYAATARG